jgi:hypothetical protein
VIRRIGRLSAVTEAALGVEGVEDFAATATHVQARQSGAFFYPLSRRVVEFGAN